MPLDKPNSNITDALIAAFGGSQNIVQLDACLTRLRITVKEVELVDQQALKKLGAMGVVFVGNIAQAIFGKIADQYKVQMEERMEATRSPELIIDLISAFGSADNIVNVDACLTRLRVTVEETNLVNQSTLQELGALGVVTIGKSVQAIFGKQSDHLKEQINDHLRKS